MNRVSTVRIRRASRWLAAIVGSLATLRFALPLLAHWRQNVRGWEAYWVAECLAAGRGYSFPADIPWSRDPIGVGFHVSAWVDPLYTYLLAGLMLGFGQYHQLAAALFNLLLLLVALGLAYRLAERLMGPLAGLLVVLMLAGNREFMLTAAQMNNTVLASVFILLSGHGSLKYFDRPSNGRAAALGAILGVTILACPSAQLFVPLTAVSIALGARAGLARRRLSHAAIVLGVGVACLLPWAARNYLVLSEIVPVRTGFGQLSFVGVVEAGATVAPELLPGELTPPWRALSASDAIAQLAGEAEKREALDLFITDYTRVAAPQNYSSLNEAQRDAWLGEEARAFMLAHPVLSAKLGLAKLRVFAQSTGRIGLLVCALALIGAICAGARKNQAASTFALWAAAFAAPTVILVCYWGRYRAPIEPILALLAAFALQQLLDRLMKGRRASSPPV